MNTYKSILAGMVFLLTSISTVFADYQVNAIKVIKGDRGGVITVQRQAEGKRSEFRNLQGTATVSDVHTELELPSEEDSLNVIVSGKIAFIGERVFQESGQLVLNGQFRILQPGDYHLELKDITVNGIAVDYSISGTILINDVEYDFTDSPDSLQRFVYRLIWWVRQ